MKLLEIFFICLMASLITELIVLISQERRFNHQPKTRIELIQVDSKNCPNEVVKECDTLYWKGLIIYKER